MTSRRPCDARCRRGLYGPRAPDARFRVIRGGRVRGCVLPPASAGRRVLPVRERPAHLAVRPTEQVPRRLPPEQGSQPPALVLWPVMDHVAPLAERREVGVRVVGRVVVPMGGRQDHPGGAHGAQHVVLAEGEARTAPSPVPPRTGGGVPPASVAPGARRSARAAAGSPHTGPLPGRTGSPPTAAANRWGRRNDARAGWAWWPPYGSSHGEGMGPQSYSGLPSPGSRRQALRPFCTTL